MAPATPQFTATRLNSTTFRIVETNSYGELPHIYVKLFNDTIVIIDTSHGRDPKPLPGTKSAKPKTLLEFLETTPIPGHGYGAGRPLNAYGKHEYTIAFTRRPTDLTPFPPTITILASSESPHFLYPKPITHLYDTDLFPHVSLSETPLTALLTPGTTPDSLCVFDPIESVLFAGDALGESVVFTLETDVEEYWKSLDKLIEFVETDGDGEVCVVASYGLSNDDAMTLLKDTKGMLRRVLRGEIQSVDRGGSRIGRVVEYAEKGGSVSFLGPEIVFMEGRKALGKYL